VTDSCLNSFDAEPVPETKKPRRTVGNKSPRLVVEARQLVLDHASKEGVSEATGWSDWKQVNSWNNEDWQKDRENMLARLQAARLRLYEKAIRKGQLQTAAQVLDSIGKVIGESVEHVSIQAPELSIRVESKQDLS